MSSKQNKKIIATVVILWTISFSCKNNKEKGVSSDKENQIIIQLDQVNDTAFHFEEGRYTDLPVYPKKIASSNLSFHEGELSFKGVPKLDSFSVVSRELQLRPEYAIDYPESLQNKIYAISGFVKNKQVVVVDTDADNDFSDERVQEFGNKFGQNHNNAPEFIDNLLTLNLSHQYFNKDKIYTSSRKIQIYPYVNHPHIYLFEEDLDSTRNNYTLMMRLKDYRKGSIQLANSTYSVGVQGLNPDYFSLVIRPDSIHYNHKDILTQQNFEYKLTDTIRISECSYSIDSISPDMSRLYLNKLRFTRKNIFGKRIGDVIFNYKLEGINGKVVQLSDIQANNKEYTLLDFWGTWCAPCKELTPRLKKIYKNHHRQISLVSIAFDPEKSDVIKYTKKNQMDWFQAYVSPNEREGSLISSLGIGGYPTFILLDKDRRIVYRGGPSSLDEIERILNR